MSMAEMEGQIWMNGQFVDWQDAKLHVLTHSLHYGMAVFEGVRAYEQASGGTAIFRLREHTQRLFNSAKIFQMEIPFGFDEVMQAQKDAITRNEHKSCYIRPLVWIGSEKMGVSPVGNSIYIAIATWPWGAYLGEDGMSRGIRVKTSSYTRHHVNVSMVRAKASGYYINSILANREVTAHGYDDVSEGAGENVFIVRNGKVYTPDLASCLDGITRDSAVTIALDLGLEVIEKRITRDEMYLADEAFFTGTAAEITPIRELDDRTIGEGKRGPITEQLQTIFFDTVAGKNKKYAHWLTAI